MAAWLDRARNLPDVSQAPFRRRQKMEYRPVMPQVVGLWFQLDFDDVPNQPAHLLRSRTQSLLSDVDGGLRDIQYGEVLVSANEKVVNQRRLAAANVNDRGGARFRCALDQCQ